LACETIFHKNQRQPFAKIWNPYFLKKADKIFCPDLKSRENVLQSITKEKCNINWREGKCYDKDKKKSHSEQSLGPAVLGFDGPLNKFCEENGKDESCEGYNRLFLQKWTLCRNLQWVLCAGMGYLPGQGGSNIMMITPPSNMDVERTYKPPKDPNTATAIKAKMEEHKGNIPERFGVTVHEVCTLNKMCSNADELFKVKAGDMFVCKDAKIPDELISSANAASFKRVTDENQVLEDVDNVLLKEMNVLLHAN
jgi:hypothetical protein